MSFQQDVFLGRGTTSDVTAELDALKERSLFVDGTKAMSGNLSIGGNTIHNIKDAHLTPQTVIDAPSSGISLFTKSDGELWKHEAGQPNPSIVGGAAGTVTSITVDETEKNGLRLDASTGVGVPITSTGTISLEGDVSVDNSNWSGTPLSIANGGSGETTYQPAIDALSNIDPSPSAYGRVLTNVGGNAKWDPPVASGDVSSDFASGTTNRLTKFTGTGGKTITESSSIIDNAGALSGITDLSASGDIDFSTADSFDVITSDNTTGSIQLKVTGGTNSGLRLLNTTGLASNSIRLDSTLGGIQLDCGTGHEVRIGSGNPPVGLKVQNGPVWFSGANSSLRCDGDIDFNLCDTFDLQCGDNIANVISLQCGGVASTMRLKNWGSTLSNAISIDSLLGGIQIEAKTNMDLNCIDGPIDIGTDLNITGGLVATTECEFESVKITTGAGASKVLTSDANGVATWETAGGGGGSGDVSSNFSSGTTNRLAKFTGTGGKTITESTSIYADAGTLQGIQVLIVDNLRLNANSITGIGTDEDVIIAANGTGKVFIQNSTLKVNELYQVSPSGTTENVVVNSSGDMGSRMLSGYTISVYDNAGGVDFDENDGETVLNLDTTKLNTTFGGGGATYTLSNDTVEVKFDGNVKIDYRLSAEETGGSTGAIQITLQVDTGGGFVDVVGSRAWAGALKDGEGGRGTASGSIALAVSNGDTFRLRKAQIGNNGGEMETLAGGSGMTIVSLY